MRSLHWPVGVQTIPSPVSTLGIVWPVLFSDSLLRPLESHPTCVRSVSARDSKGLYGSFSEPPFCAAPPLWYSSSFGLLHLSSFSLLSKTETAGPGLGFPSLVLSLETSSQHKLGRNRISSDPRVCFPPVGNPSPALPRAQCHKTVPFPVLYQDF